MKRKKKKNRNITPVHLVSSKILERCWTKIIDSLPHTPFNDPWNPGKRPFENIMGKGEKAAKQNFLLFPQRFLLYQIQKFSFYQYLKCRLQML